MSKIRKSSAASMSKGIDLQQDDATAAVLAADASGPAGGQVPAGSDTRSEEQSGDAAGSGLAEPVKPLGDGSTEVMVTEAATPFNPGIPPEVEASASGGETFDASQGVAEGGETMAGAVRSLVIAAGAKSVEQLLRFAELGKRMTEQWVDLGGDPDTFLSELEGFAEGGFVGVDLAKPGSDVTTMGIYSPKAGHRPFGGIRVTSKVEGFRRAGIVHSKTGRDFGPDELTPDQVRLIANDPSLTVELL